MKWLLRAEAWRAAPLPPGGKSSLATVGFPSHNKASQPVQLFGHLELSAQQKDLCSQNERDRSAFFWQDGGGGSVGTEGSRDREQVRGRGLQVRGGQSIAIPQPVTQCITMGQCESKTKPACESKTKLACQEETLSMLVLHNWRRFHRYKVTSVPLRHFCVLLTAA